MLSVLELLYKRCRQGFCFVDNRYNRQVHMRINLISLLAVVCASLLLQEVVAMETSYFGAPNLEGYVLHRENDGDGDGDGVEETHIKHYVGQDGSALFSMTTMERLWAWSLSTPDADAGIDSNYVIRDSNCDGVFDERYGLDEDFHIPDCLKQQPGILKPPG